MKIGYKILPALVLLLFIPLTGGAAALAPTAEPVILTDSQGEYPLGRRLELLADPTGQLTIEQASSPEYQDKFSPSQVDMPNFGLTNSAYWVRFRLRNLAVQTTEWRLVLEDPRIGYVDCYCPAPGGVKQAGRFLPFTTREVADRRFVFKLNIPAGAEQTLYLRLQSHSALWIPLTLYSLNAFTQSTQNNLLILGLFYGAVLMMLGYHTFLFLSLRDRGYLYLVLFWMSFLINTGSWDGLANQYLWPDWPNLYGLELSAALSIITGIQFTRAFLSTKTRSPRLDQVMVGAIITAILSMLLIFLNNGSFNRLTPPLIILAVSLIVVAAYFAWRQDFRPARFFLLAWSVFLVINFLRQLANLNVLPTQFFALNLGIMGSSVWLLLLSSLALTDRINLLQTQAEQANRELAAGERRLKQYLEAMPLGIVVHDTATKPHYLNHLALQIFNLADRQDLLKPGAAPNLHQTLQHYPLYVTGAAQLYPFDRLPVAQALRGEKATASDIEAEINGRRVPLEVLAAPIFNEQGQVQYAISVFQDISARQQAETALRHSQMQLQLALKAGKMGLWNWDIVTNQVQWSEEVETIFGLAPGVFGGTYQAYLDLLHPEDRPQVIQAIQRALTRFEDYHIEHRILLPGGAVGWLEGQGKVLVNEAGRPIRMAGTVQDITARKQLEERLASIYQLGQELNLLHDETAIARQVLNTALSMLRAESSGYATVDEVAGELVYRFHSADPNLTWPHLRLPLHGPKGVGVAVIHTGQPLNIPDTSQEPRYVPGPGHWVGKSALYAPLKMDQVVKGVLVVESLAPNHFTPADQLLFQTLADQATVAIENARLFQQVQSHTAELEQRVAARTTELRQVNQQLQIEIMERQRAEEAYHILVENSLQSFAIFQNDRFVFANSRLAQEMGYTVEELLAMTPEQINELIYPADRDLVNTHVQDRLSERRLPPNYEFRYIRRDGQVRWLEIFATLAEYRGQPAMQAAYIDITERKQAEAEIRRQNEYLNTLHQITLDLLNRREVDDLLQTILTRATQLVDAPYGEILQPEGDWLVTRICTPNQPFILGDRIQRGEGLLSWQAFDTGQAVLWDDYVIWPKRRSIYNPVELHATLDIPIMVGQDCLGVVALGRDRADYVFDSEQVQAGLLLAQLAGLVLDNAHWRLKAEQAAIAAERNRLAQDLHDAVTQTLFSASVIAESLPRLWDQRPAEVRRGLEELRQLTRGALAEMRALLLELRPTTLTEKKLGELLSHLTEAVISHTRLPVSLTVTGDRLLPPEVQVALYYIAQEALHNIAKHAGASSVTVSLSFQADSVELAISDDGRGFNPAAVPPDHLGVGIMRERAAKIGAQFRLDSRSGRGTHIHLRWPAPG